MTTPTGRAGRFARFARLALPAVILQSVLIGGGYATGREVVEYGGRFGAAGWLAVVTIFVGFSLLAFLTFEVARVFRAYSYKRFIEQLIGKAWPAFDLLFLVMAVLIIAVMAAAAASIMERTLGVPPLLGTALIIGAVGALTFFGSRVIEVFKTFGTVVLYGAYVGFSALVLTRRGDGGAGRAGHGRRVLWRRGGDRRGRRPGLPAGRRACWGRACSSAPRRSPAWGSSRWWPKATR